MKKILLTGGLGFFCTRFTEKYHHTFQILSTDKDDLDIINEQSVLEAFKVFKPDYVIHAAAIADTDFCNKHSELAYKINVTGAINVAKACKATGAKMVFISSEQIFNGNEESGPYSEDDTPVPNTVYGENKLEAEGLLKNILDDLWILRFTWLFGFPERNCGINPNILWNTLTLALQGEKTKITTNEYRGLTYVHELIDQFEKVFELPFDTYHVGSHNNLSRYDITAHILKELGLENRIDALIEKDTDKYSDHPRDARLCTDKIRQFGFHFSDTTDSITQCLKEFRFNI
ncbi:MAG: NAD(P)-dependent oxidoreductase [Firmicutes bacterium HGW-Firmicutes-1]|jgi:dTDP-4-dehydrorhamnose reductase|nr:MAG: NAD(P)-dependent oxidoreductase [Firmicutes bacterium HGW-Firmicutes-1]